MKLSILIPVYNEEKTVAEVLRRVFSTKLPKGWKKEIIVIDDGSTDGTREDIKRLTIVPSLSRGRYEDIKKIFHPKNLGKGAAIWSGMKEATGEVLVIQDADLEYNPDDYQKLLEPIIKGRVEVVYGSRLKKMKLKLVGKDKTPLPLHYLMNHFLSFLTNVLYQSTLTDMETCYKMMTRNVYKDLNLRSPRFEIEPEITAKILKRGYQISEVPIITKPRDYKAGKKIKAIDALKAIYTLLKFRF